MQARDAPANWKLNASQAELLGRPATVLAGGQGELHGGLFSRGPTTNTHFGPGMKPLVCCYWDVKLAAHTIVDSFSLATRCLLRLGPNERA